MSGKGVVPGRDLEIYQRNKELEMENEILKKPRHTMRRR